MTAPSRLSKEALIKKLIDEGYPGENLHALKRPQLIDLIKEDQQTEEQKGEIAVQVLEEIEKVTKPDPIDESDEDQCDQTKPEISPNSPDWTQYILGKFADDELEGKNPRVEGLRRVAEEVVGELIEEGCDLVAAPTVDNEMRVCVKCWVVFDVGGTLKRFEALADAYPGNCTSIFGAYLTAMADTRGKGRCFRNALKLRQVVAAEEIDPVVAASQTGDDQQPIDPSQSTAIRVVAKRLGASIQKCLDAMDVKYELNNDGVLNLASLTKGDAKKVLGQLNGYSSSNDGIPNELKGETNE